MFGIGGFELFLILIFGFLIFGPDKLPAIAQTVGKAIAKFRGAQEDMTEQLKTATFIDKESDEPFKNPLEVIEGAAADAKGKASEARKKADVATEKMTQAVDAATEKTSQASERTESFAERKARYDRERAARKEAEAKQAAEAEKTAIAEAKVTSDAAENPKADVAAKSVMEEED